MSDDCDHDWADLDLLTGLLVCPCGYRKWLTTEELNAAFEAEREAQEAWDAFISGQRDEPTDGRQELNDDEIPF